MSRSRNSILLKRYSLPVLGYSRPVSTCDITVSASLHLGRAVRGVEGAGTLSPQSNGSRLLNRPSIQLVTAYPKAIARVKGS